MSDPALDLSVDTDSLIDTDHREVSMRVLTDPVVYDLEMDRIFGKAWLLLGHDSEIPASGDYVVREMGNDKVIVSRDSQGEVHVLLNVCTHRGMRVCTSERGNSARFQCIYHGWIFRHNGSFVGAPMAAEQMHGNIRPKEELGLKKARVTRYGGFIFATWNFNGPSLEEWLGDYKFYLDLMFLRTADGLEVLGPPQRSVLDVNWKIPGESFAGDGYHTLTLHRSVFEMMVIGDGTPMSDENAPSQYGVDLSANGHGMRLLAPNGVTPSMEPLEREALMERLRRTPPPTMTPDMVPQLEGKLSPTQLQFISQFSGMAGGMFPNIGLLWVHTDPAPDGSPGGAMVVHTFTPRGPGKHEYLTWFLAEKCATPEAKEHILKTSLRLMGTTGLIEVDDTDAWSHLQAAATGRRGRMETIKYHALLGEHKPAGWPAGGKIYEGFSKDDTQWEWWLRWHEMMSQPAG